jgi:hypothetical protein
LPADGCNFQRRMRETSSITHVNAGIHRRARLRISKSALSKHRFSFHEKAILREGKTFFCANLYVTIDRQKCRHSSTNSSIRTRRRARNLPSTCVKIIRLMELDLMDSLLQYPAHLAHACRSWSWTRLCDRAVLARCECRNRFRAGASPKNGEKCGSLPLC